jgi:type IV secretory pathway VirB2 component (pilin)
MASLYLKESKDYIVAKLPELSEINWSAFFVLAIAVAIVVLPEMSMAQTEVPDSTISNTICNVVNQLQGPIARGVAAIGIIFLGFSLFLGKISWGVALALAIGIGAIFGANEIVNLVGGGAEACADAAGGD